MCLLPPSVSLLKLQHVYLQCGLFGQVWGESPIGAVECTKIPAERPVTDGGPHRPRWDQRGTILNTLVFSGSLKQDICGLEKRAKLNDHVREIEKRKTQHMWRKEKAYECVYTRWRLRCKIWMLNILVCDLCRCPIYIRTGAVICNLHLSIWLCNEKVCSALICMLRITAASWVSSAVAVWVSFTLNSIEQTFALCFSSSSCRRLSLSLALTSSLWVRTWSLITQNVTFIFRHDHDLD